MSNQQDGGPFHPALSEIREEGGPGYIIPNDHQGCSLRDWFAGQALAGWVAKYGSDVSSTDAALCAWEYADAMLEARTQEVQP